MFHARESRHDKQSRDHDSEIDELLEQRPAPGKSSRTHGGSRILRQPGKISLTSRMAKALERERKLDALHSRVASWLDLPASALSVRMDDDARQRTEARHTPGLMHDGIIYLHPERFDPSSRLGHEVFAHEAVHVAQRMSHQAMRALAPSRRDAEAEAASLAREFAAGSVPGLPEESLPAHAAAAFTDGEYMNEHARRASLAARAVELARQGRSIPLPHREQMEARFGCTFERVEVYTGEAAARACAMVGARAFAVGHVIALAEPDVTPEVIAHELTHVIQQGGEDVAFAFAHDLRMTRPGDAMEQEAEAERAAMAQGLPSPMAAHASPRSAAGVVLGRDPVLTWPDIDPDPDNATLFWDAAEPLGYTRDSAQRLFDVFDTGKGAASWNDVVLNLELYQSTTNKEPSPPNHGQVVPVFCHLITCDPPVTDDPATFLLFWDNARNLRGWTPSVIQTLYPSIIDMGNAQKYPLTWPQVTAALSSTAYWDTVVSSRWRQPAQALNVLPGFLHFVEHAPSPWNNAAGFLTFTEPFFQNQGISGFVDFVQTQILPHGWLDVPEDGAIFWSGGDLAQQLAGIYAAHEDLTTVLDSARTRIDWNNPPSGGNMESINTTPIAGALTNSPLWDVTAPSNFQWLTGKGRTFWRAISRVVAAGATGKVWAVLVGAPSANSVFITVEMPELLALNGPRGISEINFLCFSQPSAEAALASPDGTVEIEDLLTDAYGGKATTEFTEAQQWMLEQDPHNSALATRLDRLLLKWNPIFSIPLGEQGTPGEQAVITEDLPEDHPVLELHTVDVHISEESMVDSGTVDAALSIGTSHMLDDITYTVLPGDGMVHGIVDNTIADQIEDHSLFDGLFGDVELDWDVTVVDDGIEVVVSLAQAIALPGGLSIQAAQGRLSYSGGEGLGGAVTISVSNGSTITGDVELLYSEGAWVVSGTLSVQDLIQGMPAFAVTMEYGGLDDWRVGLAQGTSLAMDTELFGVHLTGIIDRLEMGSANRLTGASASEGQAGAQSGVGFSASGTLIADLPIIGPIEAGIEIANNQLQTVTLSAERAFSYPVESPMLAGTVTGAAVFDVPSGTLSGAGLSGTATVNAPGVEQPIRIAFSLDAGGEAGLRVQASLVEHVDINRFLRLTALSASYEQGQVALLGGAEVQNLGNVEAGVTVRIDEDGFSVEQAEATVAFGNDQLGGEVTFRYSTEQGFGFDGDLNIQLAEGMGVQLGIEYPSTDPETGMADQGTFNAHVDLPPQDSESEVQGAGPGGWQLWAGHDMGSPQSLLGTPPHLSIPIFSVGLATATIEIDADLLYSLQVEPLTVSGGVDVEGIDLANQTVRTITVTGAVSSGLTGQLIFQPRVGLGLSVVHPFLAGITGGMVLPVTATAGLDITGALNLVYRPGQGLDPQEAVVTAPLSFSLVATPKLYAELEALGGVIAPPAWQSDALTTLAIIENKKLLEVIFDLANPEAGLQINTFNPTAEATSGLAGPAGMNLTEQAATSTPGSESAASLAGTASQTTDTSDATGTAADGGMDFSALLESLRPAMPQPVQDLVAVLEAVHGAIEPIIDRVIEFLDWIGDQIRTIFADDEIRTLIEEVLPGLAGGNASNLLDLINTALSIGQTIMEKLARPLVESGDIAIMRRRKDAASFILFEVDELDSDEYSYRFHIPGIVDVNGVGDSPILSGMVALLGEVFGVEVKDIDEVEPPHMFAFFQDINGGGDVIGSASDAPQLLEGGDHFHHDEMSSVAAYGVTPGTFLHLYEHSNREGDKTTIRFATAPQPEEQEDENGLPHRQVPTIMVGNIGSQGSGEGYSLQFARGGSVHDEVSTVEIRMDPGEHEVSADQTDGPGNVYLLNGDGEAYWGTQATDQNINFWQDGGFGHERDYYNDAGRSAMLSNLPAGTVVHFYASGRNVQDADSLIIEVLEPLGDESVFISFDALPPADPRIRATYQRNGDERLSGQISQVWIRTAPPDSSE